MNFKIKSFNEITKFELYEILKLRASVFIVEQGSIYNDLDGLDYNCYHAFVENENSIIAYLRIFDRGVNFEEVSFGRVVTSTQRRNEGLGKFIVEKSIDFVHDVMKENIIRIKAQSYATPFYEKIGFVKEGNEYIKDKLPHFNMVYEKKVQ